MAIRRSLFSPREALNEGARRLRELLKKHTFKSLARRLRCDDKTIRMWANHTWKPSLVMRVRLRDTFGIPESAWDDAPCSDVYAGEEPLTTKRA